MTRKFKKRGKTLDIRLCREIKNQSMLTTQFMNQSYNNKAEDTMHSFLEKVEQ